MRRTAVAWALVSLLATPAFAVAAGVPAQNQVLNDITESVNQYVYYTIFDDVSASVEGGLCAERPLGGEQHPTHPPGQPLHSVTRA